MVRDLIEYTNKTQTEAAMIFVDQEKAFDRVDHKFLFKTMRHFGIGEVFIHWIKQLYANATTQVQVNGHLTNIIALKRGARQGDPLSFYLYTINDELLGMQLRANPNIVGFQIGEEKIVSLHYADDTTITITQNRCFKEVLKDLTIYEQGTGARMNYQKTKGLWLGQWRSRTDSPIPIKWTSGNVKHLGIYQGNKSPDVQTFNELKPGVIRNCNYWRQFPLSKLAKARVIEIFLASPLWFAAHFYPIPSDIQREFQNTFFSLFNFPHKVTTVSRQECMKLRKFGGAKLIDVQAKSGASKVKWLMELCFRPDLDTHRHLFTNLVGEHKGKLSGIDLFFTKYSYARLNLKSISSFYREAILLMTRLDTLKKVADINQEKVFYNPIFTTNHGEVLQTNRPNQDLKYYTYGALLHEDTLRQAGEGYQRSVTNILDKIAHIDINDREDHSISYDGEQVKFQHATQKMTYELILNLNKRDHHYMHKWFSRLELTIDWEARWPNIHNRLARQDTRSAIWEQIHLNEYTTHSYNKWHHTAVECPLCVSIPENEYHITLECPVVKILWRDLSRTITAINQAPVTEEEMVLGLEGKSPSVTLRNWLTFLLRECIRNQERTAYKNQLGLFNTDQIRKNFNTRVRREIDEAYVQYRSRHKCHLFKERYAVHNVLVHYDDNSEGYTVMTPIL